MNVQGIARLTSKGRVAVTRAVGGCGPIKAIADASMIALDGEFELLDDGTRENVRGLIVQVDGCGRGS